MKCSLIASFVVAGVVGLAAQTIQAPPAAPSASRAGRPRAAVAAKNVGVVVRNRSGAPLAGVTISIDGASSQRTETAVDGTATLAMLRDGTYRFRFERDGFLTLERDVVIRAGQPPQIDVALSAAPVAAPSPPAAPAPPAPVAPSSVASAPTTPASVISIPDFLDKNYIGREPLKESVLACLADSTTRLLQLHEAVGEHTHTDMDEILYVVAGEGSIRSGATASVVTAGSLTIVPHGQAHAIERRGKNPLMVMSILSGAPCQGFTERPRASR